MRGSESPVCGIFGVCVRYKFREVFAPFAMMFFFLNDNIALEKEEEVKNNYLAESHESDFLNANLLAPSKCSEWNVAQEYALKE